MKIKLLSRRRAGNLKPHPEVAAISAFTCVFDSLWRPSKDAGRGARASPPTEIGLSDFGLKYPSRQTDLVGSLRSHLRVRIKRRLAAQIRRGRAAQRPDRARRGTRSGRAARTVLGRR